MVCERGLAPAAKLLAAAACARSRRTHLSAFDVAFMEPPQRVVGRRQSYQIGCARCAAGGGSARRLRPPLAAASGGAATGPLTTSHVHHALQAAQRAAGAASLDCNCWTSGVLGAVALAMVTARCKPGLAGVGPGVECDTASKVGLAPPPPFGVDASQAGNLVHQLQPECVCRGPRCARCRETLGHDSSPSS